MTQRVFCFLLCLGLPTMTTAAAIDTLPRFEGEVHVLADAPFLVPVDTDQAVRVRFPVGELDIVAADILEVRTTLAITCRKLSEKLCEKYRKRLVLESEVIDGTVEVRLAGLPKWKLRKLHLDGRVEVPRWAPLEVRVGVGDVDIYSGQQDLTVRMGIGDLTVHVPQEIVGSVEASTRIGDASLSGQVHREGARRLLLGATLGWAEGSGAARIAVGLRIGDAKVVLE